MFYKSVTFVFVVFVFVMIYFFVAPFPNYDYVQKKEELNVCLQVKSNTFESVYLENDILGIKTYPFILGILNLKTEITNQDLRDIKLMEAVVDHLKENLVSKKQL
jgi:hypothetical protein